MYMKTGDIINYLCSDAFDYQFGVVIFRLRAGFDATDEDSPSVAAKNKGKGNIALLLMPHPYVHYRGG